MVRNRRTKEEMIFPMGIKKTQMCGSQVQNYWPLMNNFIFVENDNDSKLLKKWRNIVAFLICVYVTCISVLYDN